MARPLIGISTNLSPPEKRRAYSGKALLFADKAMSDRIVNAGGVPVLLPILSAEVPISLLCEQLDGLLLTAGADLDPRSYGAACGDEGEQWERDQYELALVHHMRARKSPIFGVCRGHQLLNVAFGGTLLNDIPTDRPHCGLHRHQEQYDDLRHALRFEPNTMLAEIFEQYGADSCNSVHHQAIDELGQGLNVAAWSNDGLIEAIYAPGEPWTWGVQWHPEWDPRPENQALFEAFIQAAHS